MRLIKGILFIALASIIMAGCVPAEERAEEHYDTGRKILFANNPKGALVEFEKGLEMMPNHDRLLYESGNCYMNFRDYVIAIDFYTKAIESNPKYADAYSNRGQCWFYLNDVNKSCADWTTADSLGKPNLRDKLKTCY